MNIEGNTLTIEDTDKNCLKKTILNHKTLKTLTHINIIKLDKILQKDELIGINKIFFAPGRLDPKHFPLLHQEKNIDLNKELIHTSTASMFSYSNNTFSRINNGTIEWIYSNFENSVIDPLFFSLRSLFETTQISISLSLKAH